MSVAPGEVDVQVEVDVLDLVLDWDEEADVLDSILDCEEDVDFSDLILDCDEVGMLEVTLVVGREAGSEDDLVGIVPEAEVEELGLKDAVVDSVDL